MDCFLYYSVKIVKKGQSYTYFYRHADIELVMDVAEFCCHNLPDRGRSIGHDHGNIYPLFDQPVQTNTKSVLFHGYTAGRLCDLQCFHVDDFARVLFHDAVGHIFSRMTWGVAPKLVRS